MLKKVTINKKKVPVPVPVRTLDEALRWIEATLVPAGHTITRVCLNDQLLTDASLSDQILRTRLDDQTRLEVQIDSPVDLTVQTLDAMRSLAAVIGTGLKQLAVDCWQARSSYRPTELDSVANDLQLMLDLFDHISALIDLGSVQCAPMQGIAGMMRRVTVALQMARANSDWKGCAKILLNRLEPLLKDLVTEAETLHVRILTEPQTMQAAPNVKAPTG